MNGTVLARFEPHKSYYIQRFKGTDRQSVKVAERQYFFPKCDNSLTYCEEYTKMDTN